MESVKTFYPNGQILAVKWFNDDGKLHREDGPAHVNYRINGELLSENWHVNGRKHRDGGPAQIFYNKNENVCEYYYVNGDLICDEFQPWLIRYEKDKIVAMDWLYDSKSNNSRKIVFAIGHVINDPFFYIKF